MLKNFVFLFFSLVFIAKYSVANEKAKQAIEDIIYQADVIQADLENGSAKLKGNVIIYFEGYQLTAHEAEIFKKEFRFTAKGSVRVENLITQITAEDIEIFFDNNTGILRNARIESGQMLFEAEVIHKLDKDVFEADKAYFTTCTTCPPLWRFKAQKIKTNISKYIDVKNTTFEIGKQPVFWLPRIILPVNTRRKTGLLMPKIRPSFSRNQVGYEQGFFWSIADNKDLTFTPSFYTRSGLKTLFNYRHVFNSESKMNLDFAYLNDNNFELFDFDTNTERISTESRWFLNFENQFYLPGNFTQKSRIKFISDLAYLPDYPDEITGQMESALENQISITKNSGNKHFSAEVIYNINLLTQDIKSDNLDAVHRTPQFKYSIINSPFLKNLRFKFDNEYVKFTRRGLSYDSVTGVGSNKTIVPSPSGIYDPGNGLIRAGERLFLNPELSSSFKFGNQFIFVPKLRASEVLYSFTPETSISNSSFPYSRNAHRTYFEGELEFLTQFSKVYDSKIKHLIEPSLTYIDGSLLHESDHVFFDSTRGLPYHRRFQPINDSDFYEFNHGIQFDYRDRIEDTRIIKISLLQTLLRKEQSGDADYYTQPLYFELSQTYDFLNAQNMVSDPWSSLNVLMKAKTKKFETFTQASRFHKIGETGISTRNKFIYKPGHFFEMTYKNNYLVNILNQVELHQEFFGLGLGWELPFLKVSGDLLYSTLDDQLQQWNLRLAYIPPGNCWEFYFHIYDSIDRRRADRPDVNFQLKWNFGSADERPKDIKAVF